MDVRVSPRVALGRPRPPARAFAVLRGAEGRLRGAGRGGAVPRGRLPGPRARSCAPRRLRQKRNASCMAGPHATGSGAGLSSPEGGGGGGRALEGGGGAGAGAGVGVGARGGQNYAGRGAGAARGSTEREGTGRPPAGGALEGARGSAGGGRSRRLGPSLPHRLQVGRARSARSRVGPLPRPTPPLSATPPPPRATRRKICAQLRCAQRRG